MKLWRVVLVGMGEDEGAIEFKSQFNVTAPFNGAIGPVTDVDGATYLWPLEQIRAVWVSDVE